MEHKNHDESADTCMLCKMHHAMHQKNMCASCMGYNHHGIVRIILALAILAFVFWAGTEMGSETRERGFREYNDSGNGAFCGGPQMMLYRTQGLPSMMYGGVQADAVTSQAGVATLPGTPTR